MECKMIMGSLTSNQLLVTRHRENLESPSGDRHYVQITAMSMYGLMDHLIFELEHWEAKDLHERLGKILDEIKDLQSPKNKLTKIKSKRKRKIPLTEKNKHSLQLLDKRSVELMRNQDYPYPGEEKA